MESFQNRAIILFLHIYEFKSLYILQNVFSTLISLAENHFVSLASRVELGLPCHIAFIEFSIPNFLFFLM